jgi:hypothetical protein
MTLEILHRALMLFGRVQGAEGTQIPPLSSLRVRLLRVKTVTAGFKFPNHDADPGRPSLSDIILHPVA